MTDKEISELRRRMQPGKNSITHICGCYVNDKKEIISEFDQSLALMEEEETELFFGILKKTLSGTQGKNLLDICFSTKEVAEGEAHRLLMTLRDSALTDKEALHQLYEAIIASVSMEGNYLLFLVRDAFDVPARSRDDAELEDGEEVFLWLLCSICPVKATKPGLHYDSREQTFHHLKTDWIISSPVLGFVFPAFDNRSTNLYSALCYTRSTSDSHEDFIRAVFNTEAPMPAESQKETFQSILHSALDDSCSLKVVQQVHDQLREMIDEHKASHAEDPLTVSRHTISGVLENSGIDPVHITEFSQQFSDEFGPDTDLRPANLVDTRQFEVKTPDVTIRINPERTDLIETRILGGVKYLMIRAEEGVEVNGVQVHIAADQ